jgi:phenylpropionate dioxygenase-like ring-hydroxylating dioxygenase large terminal subunit
MFYGRNEESGLRCVYHGWKFDVTGQCIDMPSEPPDSNYKERLKIPAYPCHESGGIVWTFMGPKDKMTGFRDFGTENLPREKWRASKTFRPMTWMQQMEGGYDTTHPSWLHMYGGARDIDANADGSDTAGVYPSNRALWKFWWHDRAPRVQVTEAWHGFRGAGLRETPNGNTHLRLYHWTYPYGGWSIPVDDNQTVTFSFNTVHAEKQQDLVVSGMGKVGLRIPESPYAEIGYKQGDEQPAINIANDFLINRELQRNGTIYSGIGPGDFQTQDVMARSTAFLDRTKEHLGTLDRKIILMRRLLINAAKNLAKGIEPPAIDPSLPYARIQWPDKVLNAGEDWTKVGIEVDPDYRRVFGEPIAVPQTIAT